MSDVEWERKGKPGIGKARQDMDGGVYREVTMRSQYIVLSYLISS